MAESIKVINLVSCWTGF